MKTIDYKFIFADGKEKDFSFQWDKDKIRLTENRTEDHLPDWTELDFCKCPNCPLKSAFTRHCPLAVSLVNLVKYFDGLKSFEKVYLEVVIDGKKISQDTTVQKAVGAMMGLVNAASGCPHLAFFKPMAYFHLPLADKENTIFRATSMYLLAQYFLAKEGKKYEIDLQGLNKIYKNLSIVNSAVADRLRAASETDSAINAIVTLDIFAKTVPIHISTSLSSFRDLFEAYFNYDFLE
ncbi:MAG TPA: hypothetical protein PLK90_08625 [Clostridiales bacterium]|nr:hypothetical protein [Clostridiales bacterium]HQP70447.1 hypothetical protein [Clostridiales bacterium]